MEPKQAGPSGLAGFLYSHNPFYLISAFLVLAGLHQALGDVYSVSAGWLLMALLCGYTMLLAATGFVIVRFGQVPERAVLFCFWDGTESSPTFRTIGPARVFARSQLFLNEVTDEWSS